MFSRVFRRGRSEQVNGDCTAHNSDDACQFEGNAPAAARARQKERASNSRPHDASDYEIKNGHSCSRELHKKRCSKDLSEPASRSNGTSPAGSAASNSYAALAGRIRWQSSGYNLEDMSSSADKSRRNLYCAACGELGGALLCHECSPRPDAFLLHYRRSYMYKALDVLLSIAEFFGLQLRRAWFLLRRYLFTGAEKSQPSAAVHEKADACALSKSSLPQGSASISRRRRLAGDAQSKNLRGTDCVQARQHQQEDTLLTRSRDTAERAQSSPKQNEPQKLQLHSPTNVTHTFWAMVNFVEDMLISWSYAHPLLVWAAWGILSLCFYCVLNCLLWPILIVLFLARRIRFYVWAVVVRWRNSIFFSEDLEARLAKQMSASDGAVRLPLSQQATKRGNSTEILSLLESQEKLFFSMPWMAVTGFSYCERLTYQELCMAVTQKLLKPKSEYARLASCNGSDALLSHLPLSAFLHPRLLAKVDRVMGRYCWVRQPGFHVTQQVVRFTKKSIDVFRQQCFGDEQGMQDSCNPLKCSCSCKSAADCNCLMDESDVICLVNGALSQPLDPTKPLWQFLYLENVIVPPDPTSNPLEKERIGSVVVFRMHHVVGDGISITRMFLKDFLCSMPSSPGGTIIEKPMAHKEMDDKPTPSEKSAPAEASGETCHGQRPLEETNDTEDAVKTLENGSPAIAASTSTMWTASGPSQKASTEASDANEKLSRPAQEALTFPGTVQAVAPQKPPVSVCSVPDTAFWRLLVAARFAFQLPFYGAAMAMLLSYDGLLKAPRSGSAHKTRISHPIRLPLKELKDVKSRLEVVLAHQQATVESPVSPFPSLTKLLSRVFRSSKGSEGKPHLPEKQNGQGAATVTTKCARASSGAQEGMKTVRLTLNDIFATCIVGGYHRCTSRPKIGTDSNGTDDTKAATQPPSTNRRKEQINFVVPVNLRRRDEDAMDLRNRFAMRGVHAALRRSLRSFALPMVMCLERWLYATWPDLLMAYFLRLTHKVGVGVSAFSCGGTVSICVSADESVVEDPAILRQCILDEYESLREACREFDSHQA
ncbi:hypothetical protein, conserved [Eimeria necatrix]|uniref:O-acyltransferase WSD1 C-terminal domain-containing protein n=1 Tax=Eimeria necatrix TaxID=51315 RepID=U6MZ44_9EIME|nr:hypothetical protein, conserved [Eimeria necatrix]CDJ68318.1 hypothetical protein, conserved [Eimeria necatrix]